MSDKKMKVYEGIDFSKFLNVQKELSEDDVLNQYEKKMRNKENFSCEFSLSDKKGNLYNYVDGGIKVFMNKKDIDPIINRFYSKLEKLRQAYQVQVTKVDRVEKIVYVSSAAALNEPQLKLISAIDEGLEQDEYVVVPATISCITEKKINKDSVAIVNLGGLGVFGNIRLAEWSPAFTYSFDYVAKVGDVVEVAVINKIKWNSGEVYDCSRKVALRQDPWKGIEQKLPLKTNVRVTCVSKNAKNFFGTIQGFSDINIYCEYPDDKSIVITEGQEYAGYVYRVNEETKLLRVRVRAEV